MPFIPRPPALQFVYKNYKGEIELRVIDPEGTCEYYPPGKNPMHPNGGWMLSGICRQRNARRTFELKSIIGPITETP